MSACAALLSAFLTLELLTDASMGAGVSVEA